MDTSLENWRIGINNGENTLSSFRDWIETNCIATIGVLNFTDVSNWPWNGQDAGIDIIDVRLPSKGAKLYELQQLCRTLQSALQIELNSFAALCQSVVCHYDLANLKSFNCTNRLLQPFYTYLMANLSACAVHIYPYQGLSNDEGFIKVFSGKWCMLDEMKYAVDALEEKIESEYEDVSLLVGNFTPCVKSVINEVEAKDITFNSLLRYCTSIAFLAVSHYSIGKRYRYLQLFRRVSDWCVLIALNSNKYVYEHSAATMIAGQLLSPPLRNLFIEKTCSGMSQSSRSEMKSRFDKLQSINELAVIVAAVRSLASHLPQKQRLKLAELIHIRHTFPIIEYCDNDD